MTAEVNTGVDWRGFIAVATGHVHCTLTFHQLADIVRVIEVQLLQQLQPVERALLNGLQASRDNSANGVQQAEDRLR